MGDKAYRPLADFARLLSALFVSGRPIHACIAGFTAGATIVFLSSPTLPLVLGASCAMACITMAGFVINDIYDRPKDALMSTNRPITIGLISPSEATIGSGFLLGVGFLVSPSHGSSLAILFGAAAAVVIYSSFAWRFPMLKGIYTALLCCTPFAYGASMGGGAFAANVYAALVLFVSGREIYLDIRDIDGDSRFGLRTIPVQIGIPAARRVAIILMVTGGLATLLLVRSTTAYLAATASLVVLGLVLVWPGVPLHRRLQLTRIPMLLGAFALASTVSAAGR